MVIKKLSFFETEYVSFTDKWQNIVGRVFALVPELIHYQNKLLLCKNNFYINLLNLLFFHFYLIKIIFFWITSETIDITLKFEIGYIIFSFPKYRITWKICWICGYLSKNVLFLWVLLPEHFYRGILNKKLWTLES